MALSRPQRGCTFAECVRDKETKRIERTERGGGKEQIIEEREFHQRSSRNQRKRRMMKRRGKRSRKKQVALCSILSLFHLVFSERRVF